MNSKKKKRGISDDLFGDMDEMFEKFGAGGGIKSDYSISVTQTPEGTKVHAKTGKNMDAGQLRKSLQQQYPNAIIEIEGGKPLIREISTKILKEKE